ncbi:MAG: hypothetical protein ACYC6Y_28710, partial [Thermoguttaceae bacterium]
GLGAENRVSLVTAAAGPRDLDLGEEVDFFADFLGEISGECEHIISQEDAFLLTEICLKAREAAETGRWVRLGG